MATNQVSTLVEINLTTGERIERELNAEELEQRRLDQAQAAAQQAEADAKTATRKSALAKLSALGLTPEEIASL
jgi:hypothetical protein